MSWMDDFTQQAGTTWTRTAQDREVWKKTGWPTSVNEQAVKEQDEKNLRKFYHVSKSIHVCSTSREERNIVGKQSLTRPFVILLRFDHNVQC